MTIKFLFQTTLSGLFLWPWTLVNVSCWYSTIRRLAV